MEQATQTESQEQVQEQEPVQQQETVSQPESTESADPNQYDDSYMQSAPTYSERIAQRENQSEEQTSTEEQTQTEQATSEEASETTDTGLTEQEEEYIGNLDLEEFNEFFEQPLETPEQLKEAIRKSVEQSRKAETLTQQLQGLQSFVDENGEVKRELLQQLATDYDTAGREDVLFQQYMEQHKDNPLYQQEPELARYDFEEQYQQRLEKAERQNWSEEQWEEYQGDEGLTDTELSKAKREAEYASKYLGAQETQARKTLKEQQQQVKKQLQELRQDGSVAPTQEQLNEMVQQHTSQVSELLSKPFEREIKLGDELGAYKMGMDETTKKQVEQSLLKPFQFIENQLGIKLSTDSNMPQFDLPKLMEAVHKFYSYDQLPQRIAKHVSDQSTISDLDRRTMNVPNANARSSQGQPGMSPMQEKLAAIRAAKSAENY